VSALVGVNGITVSYEDRGSGPPIVLLHGGLSSGAVWTPLATRLSGHYRVLTPDSRGHGHSTYRACRALSYRSLADDVAALADALELRRPVIAGWSDGGQVALELAVRHPQTVGALIVGGAHPDYVNSGLRDRSRDILDSLSEAGEDIRELRVLHDDWDGLLAATRSMWLDYDGLSTDVISRISAPVLVLAGDRDEFVDLDLSIGLYRMLTHAELAVCPGASHESPTDPHHADAFAALIADFCQRHVESPSLG
jgi:pimeloyl-ACP methyl ester carboxylesterase